MKAIVYTKYGGPEVLQVMEIEKPVPKDDEVLIKVYAASLNDWDDGLLHGDFINRLINGVLKPKRKILGSDIAGRIEAAGKNVTLFKTGDEVYGDLSGRWGGFAEYVCAGEKDLALKPAAMSFEEAAAIPQAGMLAVQGLIDKGKIQSGQKLLINGAGGGVGTFALQIAKQYGAEITGVDHTSKLDMLRSMGFDHVIDYTREDFTKNGQTYDLILDVKTNRSMFDYARSLSRHGVYVTVGGSNSRLLQALLLGPWISITRKKHIRIVALKKNKDLLYMNGLFEAGKVKPVIDGPYKFNEVPEAFRVFGKGEHKGKMVITMHSTNEASSQKFYHGTKADLKPEDLIGPGFSSNYGKGKKASYVYLTATLDAAAWGAELALGEGPGRIYIVEPTGPIEDDPNLTDKKYPGNPTKSYRTRHPLRVVGEVTDWQGHSPEQIKTMKDHLEELKLLGIEAIED